MDLSVRLKHGMLALTDPEEGTPNSRQVRYFMHTENGKKCQISKERHRETHIKLTTRWSHAHTY